MTGWLLAVDVGGTFTDVTLADPKTGALRSVKTSTTPDDPSAGVAAGVRMALDAAGVAPADVARVYHATTIATNAVLERTGAPTALICTEGFRYVLEIGRHDGPRRTSLHHWIKPERPIPPDRIFEVRERLSRTGDVEILLDEERVAAVAGELRALGVESVAICLINAYANGEHERRIRSMLLDAVPGLAVSLSVEILPAFREYERSMATALNAYVMLAVGGYVQRLAGRLDESGIDAPLSVMQSNGGLDSPASIAARPAWTVLSGPAAGVIGSAEVARFAGFGDIISLDVGGTSTDVALVRGGEPEVTDEGSIGPWPLALPMIDVHAIGAGGGSIARVDQNGGITVGPISAGSRPGPACYGLGGEDPTVTDAHLVLGRLPARLADGEIELDRAAAVEAIRSRVAEPLGLDVHEAASGIVEIADDNIAAAVRLISTERGLDPAGYVLVAGGGAGPLHAAGVAALLGMSTVLVPTAPGVLSTLGLLFSRPGRDLVRTHVRPLAGERPSDLEAVFDELEAEAGAWFASEAIESSRREHHRSVSLRYAEQASELTIGWPDTGPADDGTVRRLNEAFHARHEQRFDYHLPDAPVELVTLRVRATARVPRLTLQPVERLRERQAPAEHRRQVYVGRRLGFVDTPVIDRRTMDPSLRFAGPAVVEQSDSTVYVPPGFSACSNAHGNLVLTREVGP